MPLEETAKEDRPEVDSTLLIAAAWRDIGNRLETLEQWIENFTGTSFWSTVDPVRMETLRNIEDLVQRIEKVEQWQNNFVETWSKVGTARSVITGRLDDLEQTGKEILDRLSYLESISETFPKISSKEKEEIEHEPNWTLQEMKQGLPFSLQTTLKHTRNLIYEVRDKLNKSISYNENSYRARHQTIKELCVILDKLNPLCCR